MELRAELKAETILTQTDAAAKAARRAVFVQLVAAASFLQGEIARATPVGVTGALRKSWTTFRDEANLRTGVTSGLVYVLPTELGRKAAMPPVEPIKLWVERKLGLSDPESAGVAWAIAKKKSREFTPGQHFVEKAFDDGVRVLEQRLLGEGMLVNIVKRLDEGSAA